ncbi:response regulator transcription factor [Limnohabitans sp. DM1]|uniref:response regulator transcription factor n=1 Tax=Limnohabitans sp. DM1 TaxID=1597955 RepID=UPI000AC31496|nr:response regulator transcription factor [Limnohabitans sp. DM1]
MKLLLAEDDAMLADALQTQLGGAGFEVEHAPNGAVADYLLQKQHFDIAVLDIGMPMMDGLAVLQHVRQTLPTLPVLLLTARDALDDRVAGLQAGADDYVTKPFDFPELLARLQALLRRSQPASASALFGRLSLDPSSRRALVGGEPLDLSGREWILLELLVQQRDKVVTKEQIIQTWSAEGGEVGGGNTIEVYIHRLRRKLEDAGLVIRTVRGLGYLMEATAP